MHKNVFTVKFKEGLMIQESLSGRGDTNCAFSKGVICVAIEEREEEKASGFSEKSVK